MQVYTTNNVTQCYEKDNKILTSASEAVDSGLVLELVSTEELFTKDGAGLVSQWDDSTTNSYNMVQVTSTKQPVWYSSIDGSPAVLFDNFNDSMYADNITNFTLGDTFTIEMWVKFVSINTNGNWPFLMYFYDSSLGLGAGTPRTYIGMQTDATSRKLTMYQYADSYGGANYYIKTPDIDDVLVDDTWVHLSITREKGVAQKMYINGVAEVLETDTGVSEDAVTFGSCRIALASDSVSQNRTSNAYFDDVKIYNTIHRTGNFTPPARS